MGRVPITVMGYRCERCGYEWIPRGEPTQEPKACAKCKSPNWDKPRRNPAMTYEEFRDRIQATLISAAQPLTWTEIRTVARLPQVYPNNQWVHRLEADISLVRNKDSRGILRWRLPL